MRVSSPTIITASRIVLRISNKAKGLSVGVFFLGSHEFKKLIEESRTLGDQDKNKIKAAQFLSSLTQGFISNL
jgi:hypothetical protein